MARPRQNSLMRKRWRVLLLWIVPFVGSVSVQFNSFGLPTDIFGGGNINRKFSIGLVLASLLSTVSLCLDIGNGGLGFSMFAPMCIVTNVVEFWILVVLSHDTAPEELAGVELHRPIELASGAVRLIATRPLVASLHAKVTEASLPTVTAAEASGGFLPRGVMLGRADATTAISNVFGGNMNESAKMRTISIILPCADEQYALSTVERFCQRTPAEQLAEIIVVDDGSDPPMQKLFEEDARRLDRDARCKVRFLRHAITTGLMAAKQTGGKEARGDVVAFFDCHVSPQIGWHEEIMHLIEENPRRMVVPGITDLDLDTFDEAKSTAVNAKCYLTFDMNFKWYDDSTPFVPTISGGLVAMGRTWFNLTGGFDEGMHGWGGENLDQSLRAWLCGGEIVKTKHSRVAHMWRTADPRTRQKRHRRSAPHTNNQGRVAVAWLDAFLPIYRGQKVQNAEVMNFAEVKRKLQCKPFVYFLYRFRRIYISGGVIAKSVFQLREKASGLCLTARGGATVGKPCLKGDANQHFQLGNVDLAKPARFGADVCCSGLRHYGTNDCLDFFDEKGANFYSCDVSGRNTNQLYRISHDGFIERQDGTCLLLDKANAPVQKSSCKTLRDMAAGKSNDKQHGVFEQIDRFEPKEWDIYRRELKRQGFDLEEPQLQDS
eukprot:TRINITY_DN31322_c0_g1_i1.p1 TRINITY_DN31322_c0_g1~~TRINITY_DN31322_c0_g1_i1.p1  ORF type:complete len:690 (+),score=118.95 TRINITY_DN31322_c0_g1_i1:92-2071(+)